MFSLQYTFVHRVADEPKNIREREQTGYFTRVMVRGHQQGEVRITKIYGFVSSKDPSDHIHQ
jgi:hypothetical protein